MLGMRATAMVRQITLRPTTKIECFHETLPARINLLIYTIPAQGTVPHDAGVSSRDNNYRRYHEAIGNLTSSDASYGRRDEILCGRAEQKEGTIEQRLHYKSAPLAPGAHQ